MDKKTEEYNKAFLKEMRKNMGMRETQHLFKLLNALVKGQDLFEITGHMLNHYVQADRIILDGVVYTKRELHTMFNSAAKEFAGIHSIVATEQRRKG